MITNHPSDNSLQPRMLHPGLPISTRDRLIGWYDKTSMIEFLSDKLHWKLSNGKPKKHLVHRTHWWIADEAVNCLRRWIRRLAGHFSQWGTIHLFLIISQTIIASSFGLWEHRAVQDRQCIQSLDSSAQNQTKSFQSMKTIWLSG